MSSLWLQSCRQEGPSRFRNVRSKPDQEKVAASDKDVESKKCQGQRLPRDHAADSRASQGVRRCSYRLSLAFIGSSLSRNFRHPACPGSTRNFRHPACPGSTCIHCSCWVNRIFVASQIWLLVEHGWTHCSRSSTVKAFIQCFVGLCASSIVAMQLALRISKF